MKQDKHECQQQMIEILEKLSDRIKRVENACSGYIPALEGEYYTPPVSQMQVNKPGKLSAPPNLPIFSGQELVPSTEGSIDQWLLPGRRCFGCPYRGGSKISSDSIS